MDLTEHFVWAYLYVTARAGDHAGYRSGHRI
jgi:hypothetical protein